jgi:hypothetical protein
LFATTSPLYPLSPHPPQPHAYCSKCCDTATTTGSALKDFQRRAIATAFRDRCSYRVGGKGDDEGIAIGEGLRRVFDTRQLRTLEGLPWLICGLFSISKAFIALIKPLLLSPHLSSLRHLTTTNTLFENLRPIACNSCPAWYRRSKAVFVSVPHSRGFHLITRRTVERKTQHWSRKTLRIQNIQAEFSTFITGVL